MYDARIVAAVVLGLSLAGTRAVEAQSTATGTMGVSATVVDSCSVVATTLTFSTYSAANAQSTGTATLTVTCTIGTAVSLVGLDFGLNAVAGVAQLKATGAALIPYVLYQNVAFTTLWTATLGPGFAAIATPTVFTVYGRAPGGANVPTGTYTDTVGITITYV
jgi:spore coat protein U-like protein